MCMLHLLICRYPNSSPITCPPSSVLCWCLLCIWFNVYVLVVLFSLMSFVLPLGLVKLVTWIFCLVCHMWFNFFTYFYALTSVLCLVCCWYFMVSSDSWTNGIGYERKISNVSKALSKCQSKFYKSLKHLHKPLKFKNPRLWSLTLEKIKTYFEDELHINNSLAGICKPTRGKKRYGARS